MRAIRYYKYGGPEVLRYEVVPRPAPGTGQVLVEVAGTSFNPADAAIRSGALRYSCALKLPHIPGVDLSGWVAALGPGVTGYRVGDPVIAYLPAETDGAMAQLAVVPADGLAPAPQSIALADAAALPVAGLTAWQAVHEQLRVEPGQRILVNGAGGAVGRLAVQFAKLAGATVIGRAGPASIASALTSGADLVVDRGAAGLTMPPFDGVLNAAPASGAELSDLVARIRPGGSLVSITGPAPIDRPRSVTTSVMTVRRDAKQLAEIARLVDTAGVSTGIAERLPLTEAPLVHRRYAAGALRGKVVLSPPPAA
ncbi:NADPH:quinone reductase [Paractinoplanes deccanensis]|uniref:NADPH:quinone reductase n=1 Tax=Paractinoplanes deccanensis TaxID=113561 RepID=A0ABQ3YAL0_9ACTN|nr:NADP-dependent oxidoreductase [Actinoplanes deccanensis]GID77038.1 NADPH:quinone reductase [Actinoplanes deccanensis]